MQSTSALRLPLYKSQDIVNQHVQTIHEKLRVLRVGKDDTTGSQIPVEVGKQLMAELREAAVCPGTPLSYMLIATYSHLQRQLARVLKSEASGTFYVPNMIRSTLVELSVADVTAGRGILWHLISPFDDRAESIPSAPYPGPQQPRMFICSQS